MKFLTHAPHPALRAVVRTYWTLEGVAMPDQEERILPDGHGEIVIHLGDPFWHSNCPQPGSLWIGQMRTSTDLSPRGRVSAFGVSFTPHGAAAFTRFPQHETVDRIVPLEDVFPRDAWRERLGNEPSLAERVAAADEILLRRFQRPPDRRFTRALAYLGQTRASIDSLATQCGVSRRQLERQFRSTTGLSPKTMHRIFRFQRTLGLRAAKPEESWAAIAAESGYYDQSHLIADFRQFSGGTPQGLEESFTELGRHFVR